MPELPEVEVVRRQLRPHLVGHTIRAVSCAPDSYFFLTPPGLLRRRLPGRRVDVLERHGKYLLLRLHDGARLLWHLGMTGQLLVVQPHDARYRDVLELGRRREGADPHLQLGVRFSDAAAVIAFRDVRKFGKCGYLAPGEQSARVQRLGVDALDVTPQLLFQRSRARSTPVKSLLLDQGVLAGIGNIYADESLFVARIAPRRAANRLTRSQCQRLAEAIRWVLRRAIRAGGSTLSDYRKPDGSLGGYQLARQVYGRLGQPCRACAAAVERTVIAQRSTHYCPNCQR